MRDKTPRFFPGDGISAGLLHWPSSCGTRSPLGFLRAAPPNGRAFCCLDNTPVCERRFGNPQTGLRRRGKSSRLPPCVVSVYAGLCPRGKHSDSSPADRGMRSVEAGSVGWLRVAHTAWSPENRSLAWPSSRYSLAWCSRDRPPSVAVFYSAAVPGDPLLAITDTVDCRRRISMFELHVFLERIADCRTCLSLFRCLRFCLIISCIGTRRLRLNQPAQGSSIECHLQTEVWK